MIDPENRDDWGDDVRRRIDEAKGYAADQKEVLQDTEAYRGWKSWSPTRRFFTVGLGVIGLIILIALIGHFADIPNILPPASGE